MRKIKIEINHVLVILILNRLEFSFFLTDKCHPN